MTVISFIVSVSYYKKLRGIGLRTFIKNAAMFSAGTLGAQLIGIFVIPLITRLYSTESFGIFSVLSSLSGLFAIIFCLRLDYAIPLPFSRQIALALVQAANLSILAWEIFILLGYLFVYLLINIKAFGATGPYLWTLCLATPAAALQLVGSGWNVRQGEFRTLSLSQVVAALVTCIGQFVGGVVGAGPLGLILGTALGWWIAASIQFRSILNIWRHEGWVRRRLVQRAVVSYKHFFVWTMPSSVINSLSVQLMPLVIVSLYGAKDGGLFFLAYRVVSLPVSLIGTGLGRVMWGKVAKLRHTNSEKLLPLFLFVSFGSLALTSPGLILIPFSRDIFSIAFGREWAEAGSLAAVLSISAWLSIFIIPSSNLSTLGYNHWQTGWEILRVIGAFCVVVIAVMWHITLMKFVVLLTSAWSVSYIILFILNLIAICRTARGEGGLFRK